MVYIPPSGFNRLAQFWRRAVAGLFASQMTFVVVLYGSTFLVTEQGVAAWTMGALFLITLAVTVGMWFAERPREVNWRPTYAGSAAVTLLLAAALVLLVIGADTASLVPAGAAAVAFVLRVVAGRRQRRELRERGHWDAYRRSERPADG